MTWNWDPSQWKKSRKILLGIATIWPAVYMFLFMGTIFLFIVLLPFRAEHEARNCGNVDELQLDRKILNGEIKKLIVYPTRMVAFDRIGDCQFDVGIENQVSRQNILDDARQVVSGHVRVEEIKEEAEAAPPFAFPLGFGLLMVAHLGTMFLIMALMPLYIIFAVKNEGLDQTMRIVWVVLACTFGMLANPVYWYLYVWRSPVKPFPALENSSGSI